jgi:hypothetical protein
MLPRDPEKPYGADLVRIAENQPEFLTLPARYTRDGEVYTMWEFTDAEKEAIANGARLHIRVLTFGRLFQPIGLAIEGTPDFDVFYE